MSATEHQVDLTSCDREPIHQLGHVQPFGAMLVVSSDNFIAHFSQNAGEFLDIEGIEQGALLNDLLPPEALSVLQNAAEGLVEPDDTERVFALSLHENADERFDCSKKS